MACLHSLAKLYNGTSYASLDCLGLVVVHATNTFYELTGYEYVRDICCAYCEKADR